MYTPYLQRLDMLRNAGRLRTIPPIDYRKGQDVIMQDHSLLNFSSNDYLALSTHTDLVKEFTDRYSNKQEFLFSAASARLLSGNSAVYGQVEQALATLFRKEACLFFNTGYQCNLGVISALMHKGDVIFADKLVHASIIAGMQLSGATFYRYQHLNYDHLEEQLKKHRQEGKQALIITESVFSMDGDYADLDHLIALKQKYNALLMVDEAHAFGIFGDNLAGMGEGKDIDVITATCGKALASCGAFCIASRTLIDTMINAAGSFIFSTALPPINMLWTQYILTNKRELLHTQSHKLRMLCHELNSPTQIIPVLIGESDKASLIAHRLREAHYFVWPVRPPTVPQGTARLRLSLTADMDVSQVRALLKLIQELMA